jgi:iron complex transport system ATP-binding protein
MTAIVADSLIVRRGAATLLDGVSLSFGPTGSVAVIGPNGAGKSTLLKILAGIEPPTSGSVKLDERPIASMSGAVRARAVGFIPQHFDPHWDLSVGELVRLGAERGENLPSDAVERAIGAYELEGLEARRWSTLSGGEKTRVLLASVLVVDPKALLADEPAAALDIRHRLDVLEALGQRGGDRLSVAVIHDLDLAFRFFDRVVLMAGGRIVADKPASELFEDPKLDEVFGVRFERVKASDGWTLRAAKPG